MFYENVDPGALKIDSRELSARLGAPITDGEIKETEIYLATENAAHPSYVAVRANLSRENGVLLIENHKTHSRALGKVCENSEECILLVATLGVGVDRLIARQSSISAHKGFLADAMADALIEALCDYAEDKLCQGLDTSGRFSPGYADLELEFGRVILSLTDAERRLGIKLTEGGMMVPRKSVSAIIAVKGAQVRE